MSSNTTFLHYRHLLLARLISDLRTNIAGTRMGYLWMVIDPLLLSAVYYFIVVFVFDRGGPNYYLFILLGLWPWLFFSRALAQATVSIERNRNLILTVRAPMLVYVLSPILLNGVLSLVGILITLLFIDDVGIVDLAVILGLFVLLALLTLGISSFTAIANCFLADVAKLLGYGLRVCFFLTPILYDQTRITNNPNIPDLVSGVLTLNPLLYIVESIRSASIRPQELPLMELAVILVVSLVLIVAANLAHTKLRNQIVARI